MLVAGGTARIAIFDNNTTYQVPGTGTWYQVPGTIVTAFASQILGKKNVALSLFDPYCTRSLQILVL